MSSKSPIVRRRIAAGVAIVVILALTGTATTVVAGSDSNTASRGVVLFVGDSNVTISASQIILRTTAMNHHNDAYVPVMASRVGAAIRTYDCLDPIGCTTNDYWRIKLRATWEKIEPDAIVNNLGINDTTRVGTQTTPGYGFYGKKIDWFMSSMPQRKPVFWTTLPCKIEPPVRFEGCKAVNTALSAAQQRWPNLVMVNWATQANSHPEYLMRLNGKPDVHLSPEGSSAWTAAVTAAMDARLPAT